MSAMAERAPLIAHVDAEHGFSGGEVQVFLLIAGLRELGWRNLLVCPPGSGAAQAAARDGLETEPVEMRGDADLLAVMRLARLFTRRQPDLVHLHTGRATWLGGLAARWAGLPAITTRRMDRPVHRGWRTSLIYNRLVCRAAAISPAVAERLAAAGVAREKTVLIPSALDPRRITPSAGREATRTALAVSAGVPVVLTVAALVRRKGVDVLLDAAARLQRQGSGFVLWVVGDGPERSVLETQACDLGLQPSVRFLGRREDVADLLAACDVFVLASRREGLGVAALEAMAAARPVVASAVGGLRDAVGGAAGVLVPPEDAAALAAALANLLADAERRAELGAAGREWAWSRHVPQHMVSEYVRVYRDVLEQWPKNRR
jgi:glycosyltransferase involved in cell wall biosynthesis